MSLHVNLYVEAPRGHQANLVSLKVPVLSDYLSEKYPVLDTPDAQIQVTQEFVEDIQAQMQKGGQLELLEDYSEEAIRDLLSLSRILLKEYKKLYLDIT